MSTLLRDGSGDVDSLAAKPEATIPTTSSGKKQRGIIYDTHGFHGTVRRTLLGTHLEKACRCGAQPPQVWMTTCSRQRTTSSAVLLHPLQLVLMKVLYGARMCRPDHIQGTENVSLYTTVGNPLDKCRLLLWMPISQEITST